MGIAYSQNTISVRKTDTSFNAIFYSDKIFEHKSFTTLNGKEKHNKKARMYYVFGKDGSIWFFIDGAKIKKVLKSSKGIVWKKVTPTGKYYIKNTELVIYPYHRSMTGELVLNEVYFDGNYKKSIITITQNGIRKKLILLTNY